MSAASNLHPLNTPSRSRLMPATNPQSTPLKTADTLYGGVLFRSRLEARWAFFLDCLRLRWQYEPEAFLLPDGTPYVPTFLIHTPQGERRWICIKPAGITSDPHFTAFEKAIEALEGNLCGRTWPTLASGSPLEWMQAGHTFCPRCGTPYDTTHYGGTEDFTCWACDWETPFGGGNPPQDNGVKGITYTPHKGHICLDSSEALRWHSRIFFSAKHAQAYRLDFAPVGGRH